MTGLSFRVEKSSLYVFDFLDKYGTQKNNKVV